MTVARAVRYRTLVKEAAKQLRCKPSSELAKHVGTLRLARETFAERLIGGRDVDPGSLLKLDHALKVYMPADGPPAVQLTIQPVTLCAKCRAEVEGEPPPPLPPAAVPFPPPLAAVEAKSAADPVLAIILALTCRASTSSTTLSAAARGLRERSV
jgi:hypothetical protein